MKERSFGRYQLRDPIGRGTTGIVYRGYDPVLDREIALKTIDLPPGLTADRRERFMARFLQEAKIAGKLLHPNIVVTHDAAMDEASGTPFIAMELLSGESMSELIEREGALPWRKALELVVPLAEALDYAHQHGVVHRDIKPANVLLTARGVPKIADFGIAKLPSSELTQTGSIVGTPYFMSPEQLEGDDVDGRSDLFSLGALLYNLLVGTPPFRGTELASITQQVLYKNPPPPSETVPDVPESLDGVLARAMAKTVDERYETGAEMAEDLNRTLRGEAPSRALPLGEKTLESPSAPSSSPSDGAGGASSSLTSLLRTTVVAVLLGVAAGGLYLHWDQVRARLGPLEEELRFGVSLLGENLKEHQAEQERRDQLQLEGAGLLERARDLLERGHWERARSALERSLAVHGQARDGEGEARTLLLRGRLASERGEWSRARADFEAAASVFQIYDLPEGRAEALLERAHLERDLGELDKARALYDAHGGASSDLGKAVLELMEGNLDTATSLLERAHRESHSTEERDEASIYRGTVAHARGELEEAQKWWKGVTSTDANLWLAYAALARSDADGARELFETVAPSYREHDHRTALVATLEGLRATGGGGRVEDELRVLYGRLGLEPTASLDGRLRPLFLAEPRTLRSEERRRRLP